MSTATAKSDQAALVSSASAAKLTSRQRFQRACRCQPVDRPPVWLMRQAGRALPEYRKLKEKHTFLELVQNPELSAEVTLQPVRRFGFDAAILFSDILVIPEAMGQPYHFRDAGGVAMDFAVRTSGDIQRLSADQVTARLDYVDKALRLSRKELGGRTALIGFAGSPWTLATFMLEGGSAEKYTRAPALFREDRKTFYALAEKLTVAVTAYLQMQTAAGVDALQIFDSHGGLLAPTEFPEASGRWIKDIVTMLGQASGSAVCPKREQVLPAHEPRSTRREEAHSFSGQQVRASLRRLLQFNGTGRDKSSGRSLPRGKGRSEAEALGRLSDDYSRRSPAIIVFSLGTHGNWDDLLATGASVLGIDWQFSLAEARKLLPASIGLQGNLAPALLSDATPADVARETTRLLEEMRGRKGYIFNLGHGVPPAAKLENIAALVETVRSFK